jgi:hypothetical protein
MSFPHLGGVLKLGFTSSFVPILSALRPTLGGFAFRSGASSFDPCSGASPFARGLHPSTHAQGLRLSLGAPPFDPLLGLRLSLRGSAFRPTLGGSAFHSGAPPFTWGLRLLLGGSALRPTLGGSTLRPTLGGSALRPTLVGSALWPTPGGFTFSTCARGLHPFDLCSRTLPLDQAVQGRHTKLHTTRNKEGNSKPRRCIHKKQARFIYLAGSLRYDTLVRPLAITLGDDLPGDTIGRIPTCSIMILHIDSATGCLR